MIKQIQELEKKSISLDPDLRQSPVSSTNIQMQSLKKKCDELEEKLDMERNTSKDLRNDYAYVVEIYEENVRELKSLQENVGPVFDENEKLKSYMQTYEKQTRELKLHHDRELQTLKAELQDTKTRLSKLMSAQVMNNNPDIADLNDAFRPNKLSEMYRELYDNQWSEAFDALQGNERENVQILREILKDARQFCEDEAKLAHCLFGREWSSFIPNTLVKDMKDLTKAVLPYTIDIVGERYLEKRRGDRQCKEIEPYYRECAKVCWIMVLNDPPVEFGLELKTGDIIEKGIYSLYTSSGDTCDYEVWPALFMSKSGALVSKGVVQAIETTKPTSKQLTVPRPNPVSDRNVVIRGLDRIGRKQATCPTAREKQYFSKSLYVTPVTSYSHINVIYGKNSASSTDYIQTNVRSSEQEQRYPGRSFRVDSSQSRRQDSSRYSHF